MYPLALRLCGDRAWLGSSYSTATCMHASGLPMIRPLALLILFAALLAPVTAAAAASPAVRTDHLQSRLVSEATAAVPGTRLTLGLLLEHDPHWHTYWRNPGDSGLPTQLDLTLPEGVVAEPIAWPHPQRFELADIVNFGYGERRLLPVSIMIPADYDAPSLPVRAAASWLICEVECIPGNAEYTVELPVAPTANTDSRWVDDYAAARVDLPRAAEATLSVAEDADTIVLTLGGLDAGAAPAQWQWFPETPEVVANGAQPQWQRAADGWRARWLKSEYFTALPPEVALVAVDADGTAWHFATGNAGAAATTAAPPFFAVVPGDAADPAALGLLPALLFAFIGGLILNLMPCVFPVLSIKAMGALNSADDRAELRRHGGWYTLGVVATFLVLAGMLLALRAGGAQLGWGFQLQEPRFVAGVALLLFAMALSFSGVWEFGGRLTGAGQRLTEGHGARASFFTGALAVVVASPCTAPFMGTALGWALAQPAAAACVCRVGPWTLRAHAAARVRAGTGPGVTTPRGVDGRLSPTARVPAVPDRGLAAMGVWRTDVTPRHGLAACRPDCAGVRAVAARATAGYALVATPRDCRTGFRGGAGARAQPAAVGAGAGNRRFADDERCRRRAVERAAPRRAARSRPAGAGEHDRRMVHHLPRQRTHGAVHRYRARGARRARRRLPQG